MSSVLFLFLAHLGIGITGTLILVGESAGIKFFRFNSGLAGALLLIALAMRPETPVSITSGLYNFGLVSLSVSAGAIVIYWATIGRLFARIRPLFLWGSLVSGVVALLCQGVALSAIDQGVFPVITVASFISSAALLGGSCTAMILGHWYLVLPSMDVSLLQAMVKFHIVSTFLRIFVVIVVVWIALTSWQAPSGATFVQYVWSLDGVFLWQRVLFGLVGPLVLAFLTWETAKIRSTQSATGILYVDFFTVIVGEVLAKYLLITMRIPL